MALQEAGLKLVAEGAAQYVSQIAGADSATQQFAGGLEGAGGRASGAASIMTGALERVGHIAVDALGQAAQAAGQFVADSITAAGDFEASVNNLAAISGTALADAGFSFDDVSAKALQLGQDTKYSAAEAVTAMTELVKGGVPIADVMTTATDATLNLAAAAGVELGSAAEIVSKQLGVWGETGVEATQVADLLTQAANASTVGVEDLALGLANAGGTAKTAGVGFQDLTTTMALIAPGFSSAADAGTSLKTMIARLQPTTAPAIAAMEDLGLYTKEAGSVFYDAQGNFIGMQAAAEKLHTATAGLSDAQKVMALQTIFGSDAIRAAAAIADAGGAGFEAMGASMAAAGTAAETAAIQNQGFNFAMESLKGSIETVQIVIGSMLLPVLTSLINTYLIPGVNVVMQFAQALGGNGDALAALSPQIQLAVAGVQSFLVAAQPVADFIGANLVPILSTLAAVAGGLLVSALVSAAAPFAPLIGLFGAAIAIGAALYGAWQSDFGGIQETTNAAMAAIQSVIQSVLAIIQAFWQEHGAQIIAFAQQAWTQIQQIIGNVAAIIGTIVSTYFGFVANFISDHSAEIQSILTFAWNTIQNIIQFALDTIQGITTTVLGILTGDWEQAGAGIQQIVQGLANFVQNTFNNLVGLIQGLTGRFLSAAREIGQAIIDGIVHGIEAGISAVLSAARDMAQRAIDAAMSALGAHSPSKEFAQLGMYADQGLAEGLIDNASLPAAAAEAAAAGATSAAREVVSSPAASYSTSSASYGGDTINVTINGSGLNEAQLEGAITRALGARTTRASRLARVGGGAG